MNHVFSLSVVNRLIAFKITTLFISVYPAYGVAVTVVGDTQRAAEHAQSMAKWADQISKFNEQLERSKRLVQQTDQLLGIIGNPKSVIDSVSTIGGAAEQLDYIFRTETSSNLRKIVTGTETLTKKGVGLKDAIGDSVILGKEPRQRNASLYSTYSLLERMHKNYEDLIEADKRTQEREIYRQKSLLEALRNAQTEWERESIRGAIAASKGIQDASTNAVLKAKAEYDAESLAMELETQKQVLAQWEEHQMKKNYQEELNRESTRIWQEHLEDRMFKESQVDTRIELYTKLHNTH